VFVALYEFQVRSGCEADFEIAWQSVTDMIFDLRGSWGSRLHTTEAPGVYVAYAQWPSAEAFDELETPVSPGLMAKIEHMRAMTDSIRLVYRMTVCEDRLQTSDGRSIGR
jgi:hypothetical protein